MNKAKNRMPVLFTGDTSKNSFEVKPSKAADLKWIRATALNVLRDCPEQFYTKFCLGLPQVTQPGPNYALIGTMFHEVVESYILDGWEINDPIALEIQKQFVERNVRESEVFALGQYLQRLREYRKNTIKVEHEFEYKLVPGLPGIRGHIDYITKIGNKKALIIDHKTNRQPKSLDKWIDDLQTICYAWATRKLLGSEWEIHFKIGYINLPYDADWLTQPSFDQSLATWYKQAWKDLLEQEKSGIIKRTPNTNCKYCPLTGNCEEEEMRKDSGKNILNITLQRLHK